MRLDLDWFGIFEYIFIDFSPWLFTKSNTRQYMHCEGDAYGRWILFICLFVMFVPTVFLRWTFLTLFHDITYKRICRRGGRKIESQEIPQKIKFWSRELFGIVTLFMRSKVKKDQKIILISRTILEKVFVTWKKRVLITKISILWSFPAINNV